MNYNLVFLTSKRYKSFTNIPGPQSLPVLGTLYQYFPIIGIKIIKFRN